MAWFEKKYDPESFGPIGNRKPTRELENGLHANCKAVFGLTKSIREPAGQWKGPERLARWVW